jgi:hypothetical protein
VLSLNTWYQWAYVKNGDVHNLYLSTELGTPLDLDLAIGPETQAVGFTVPGNSFVYGALGYLVPKALKIWETNLSLAELAIERETYRGARHTNLLTVGQWRTGGGLAPGTEGYYSGWPNPFNDPIVGGGTTWDRITGPILGTLPARPFGDDFESYLAGEYDGNYTPGVIDAAQNWEFGTAPVLQAWVNPTDGQAGSQGFDTRQSSAAVWFEHDGYTGRCGNLSVWSIKRSDSQVDLRHGLGLSVLWRPDPLENATGEGFGFRNINPTTPVQPDQNLYVFNTYPTTAWTTVSNVYIPDQYQLFEVYWILSSVNATLDGIDADGELYIYVDGVLKYSATGLSLVCTDTDWASDINTWNTIDMPWGGLIDNLNVGTTCFGSIPADYSCPFPVPDDTGSGDGCSDVVGPGSGTGGGNGTAL